MDTPNEIVMDLEFSLKFHTGTNEEITYSAKLEVPSDPADMDQKFRYNWQVLEDQVFGKIEQFIANNNK